MSVEVDTHFIPLRTSLIKEEAAVWFTKGYLKKVDKDTLRTGQETTN